MNRYQFEVLTYIEKNGKKEYPMRTLSDTLKISGTAISKALDELENEALIKRCEDQMEITAASRRVEVRYVLKTE